MQVWNKLDVICFRPRQCRGSFFANFCPMFVAFLEPQIQLAIDQSLPTPTYLTNLWKVFANSWMFYQEALPRVWFLSCVDGLLTIGHRQWWKLVKCSCYVWKANSPFLCGAYFCMGAYKYYVDVYFVWVPIILILRCTLIYLVKVP